WAGGPGADTAYRFGMRKGAYKALAEVRALLRQGRTKEAHRLANSRLTGIIHTGDSSLDFGDYGAQQTMGDLYITPGHKGRVMEYRRELDIGQALGRVSYTVGGAQYERMFFGSYPRKVMVYRFTSSVPESYTLRYKTPHKKEYEYFRDGVYACGGSLADNGQRFETAFRIITDGRVAFRDGRLEVSQASDLTILHAAATDYLDEYPGYKGNDFKAANNKVLEA